MPVDSSIVDRAFPPSRPYAVTEEKVREFAAAVGSPQAAGDPVRVPPTFPIVLAVEAMNAFLAETGLDLSRIVHGEQRFTYERPVQIGDVLTATLTVASLRSMGGNDLIGTRTVLADPAGATVCTASATLIHRGEVA